MAHEHSDIKLFISRTKDTETKSLGEAMKSFVDSFAKNFPEKTYALLYAPKSCFLAILKDGKLHDENGEINAEKEAVFEARIFNETAELRWLNVKNGEGKVVVLSKESKAIFAENVEENHVGTITQSYLLWGKSTGGWTQFAEARIGAYFVPLKDVPDQSYARFTAIEYLSEYKDGNVAVAEERLTGIEVYKETEQTNG